MAKKQAPFPLADIEFSRLVYTDTKESSVTTAWGVDWSDDMIARDLMQNFFDANQNNIEQIETIRNGSAVTIKAPAEFDLQKLYYLASEKGEDQIGQYGEGFKAAAMCLLRRYPQAVVIAASGKDAVWVRLGDHVLSNSSIQPMIYQYYKAKTPARNSCLIIRNTSSEIALAIEKSLNQFFYPENAIMGELLIEDRGKFSIYRSTDGKGHLFYRKLRRAQIADIPLVMVIHKAYQQLERKIGQDRDRKAFNEDVIDTFYRVWATNFFKGWVSRQSVVIQAARDRWEQGKGHPLLAMIAESGATDIESSEKIFCNLYFAESSSRDSLEQEEFKRLEAKWSNEGRKKLPSYFGQFGVTNAKVHFQKLHAKADAEAKENGRRGLSTAEALAKEILDRVIQAFAPELWDAFGRRVPQYSVAETEVLLGQFRSARPYRSSEVFLAATVFTSEFASALAVYVHEHAHIYGGDGSRGFTDALTWLMAALIRNRDAIAEHEVCWIKASQKVLKERKSKKSSGVKDCHICLDALAENELRDLLKQIPIPQLNQLLAIRNCQP